MGLLQVAEGVLEATWYISLKWRRDR